MYLHDVQCCRNLVLRKQAYGPRLKLCSFQELQAKGVNDSPNDKRMVSLLPRHVVVQIQLVQQAPDSGG